MDQLPTTETLVKPPKAMDASDALYLNTLCDRRDAAMLSPFTDAEGLLAGDDEIADERDAPTATAVTPS